MTKKLLLTLALLMMASAPAAAAIDCANVKLPTEIVICQDDELGDLEDTNARVYAAAREEYDGGHGLHSFDNAGLAWIKKRNTCGRDKDCIASQYTKHISDLCKVIPYKKDIYDDCAADLGE